MSCFQTKATNKIFWWHDMNERLLISEATQWWRIVWIVRRRLQWSSIVIRWGIVYVWALIGGALIIIKLIGWSVDNYKGWSDRKLIWSQPTCPLINHQTGIGLCIGGPIPVTNAVWHNQYFDKKVLEVATSQVTDQKWNTLPLTYDDQLIMLLLVSLATCGLGTSQI